MKHLPKACKLFYIVPLLLSACNNDGPISSSSLLSSSEESTSSSSSQYSSSSSEYSSYDSISSVSSYSNPIPEEEIVPFSSLTTTKSKMTLADYQERCVKTDKTINVLVTFISFTDGYKVDKAYFEKLFTGEYDINNCIRSVSSYFKYNSYGKVNFDFTFYYYDSPMSCSEAWHYVNDEDEFGYFYANQYIEDIFKEVKADINDKEFYQKLDGDNNGFVDFPIFVFGEDTSKTNPEEGNYYIYGSAVGSTEINKFRPDVEDPSLKFFIRTDYETMLRPADDPAHLISGPKTLIHECSHMLGLPDYYDFNEYEGRIIDTFGGYTMMSHDVGDWDPFSKFCTGFLEPYVVEQTVDKLTIRLRNSSEYNEAILVPLSRWNETCFDEYLLVDVMAPVGANGFDWDRCAVWPVLGSNNLEGGVRILHIDNRLQRAYYDEETSSFKANFINPFEAKEDNHNVSAAFTNSNAYEPNVEGESRFYHLVEMIPSDLSSKYRLSTTNEYFPVYWMFNTNDLFGPGDCFKAVDNTCEALVNAPFSNNHQVFQWSITVQEYDTVKHEAVITLERVWFFVK